MRPTVIERYCFSRSHRVSPSNELTNDDGRKRNKRLPAHIAQLELIFRERVVFSSLCRTMSAAAKYFIVLSAAVSDRQTVEIASNFH